MKNKKIILIPIIVVLLGIIGFGIFYFLNNEDEKTTLSLLDKQWIEKNKNNVVDLSIFTGVSTISDNGTGLVFDFLNSLKNDTTISFNNIAYPATDESKTNYAFKIVDKQGDKQLLLYRDNSVLISKQDTIYGSINEIKDLKIGVLNSDKERASKYMSVCQGIELIGYDSADAMLQKMEADSPEVNAVILPRLIYLDKILTGNYNVLYNLTDLTDDYVLNLGDNDKLNEILTKYFNKWESNNSEHLYKKYLADDIVKYMNIDEKSKSNFKGKRYTYGFVENAPYDLTIDGELKGINKEILENFNEMYDIEFVYKKYSSYNNLKRAFNNKEVDIFFDSYFEETYEIDSSIINSNYDEKAVVLTNKSINVDSIYSLIGEQVIALENSALAKELEELGISVKTIKSVDSIITNASDTDIIVLDSENYNYYVSKSSLKYKNVYTYNMTSNYTYRVNNTDENKIFINVFDKYLEVVPVYSLVTEGYNDILNIKFVPIIIKYVSIALAALIALCLVVFAIIKIKNSKHHEKAFTKEDKLRYIDMLTSLKNRNYLNDNLEKWDSSEIYPQAIIIIDLNNIAYINDNYGHEEGDKIIGEAANILIKTQMANTDIIRTNGNEFLIYLVSYNEKQVVSYIRTLNKEFKELSHKFGAAIGYSMILDAIKTVDDAINEATLDMRTNKEENNN